MMRYEHTTPYKPQHSSIAARANGQSINVCLDKGCIVKNPNTTFLETFNCENHVLPGLKPKTWCAKKQIYKPSYVLMHFIHYSPITLGHWNNLHRRRHGAEKGERDSRELDELVMIHTKTKNVKKNVGWQSRCKFKCDEVGFVWPRLANDATKTSEGYKFNCWAYQTVDDIWVPRLEEAMRKRMLTDGEDVPR